MVTMDIINRQIERIIGHQGDSNYSFCPLSGNIFNLFGDREHPVLQLSEYQSTMRFILSGLWFPIYSNTGEYLGFTMTGDRTEIITWNL